MARKSQEAALPIQGLSKVVFASDKGQGFVRSGGVSAEGGGFVLDGVSIEEIESEVA